MAENRETVEVVYATPDQQHLVKVRLEPGLTACQAVERSGLLESCAIDRSALVLGIFGTRIEPARRLRAGDRVEICRPLAADPRQMRRTQLAHGRVMGKPAAVDGD